MSENKEYIKLSEYAKFYEIPYRTAFDWWIKGKLRGYQNDKGSIFIEKDYVDNIDRQEDKLISQKYFMECIDNNKLLSCVANVIFGNSKNMHENQCNIDDTKNIDVILDKVNKFVINTFVTCIYDEICKIVDVENITNIDKSTTGIYINKIVEQIYNQNTKLILANRKFINVLQQTIFYKKDSTFNNIPVLELQGGKLPNDIDGFGLFINDTSLIDIYVRDMPCIVRTEDEIKLSITYSATINPNIDIIPFCFTDKTKNETIVGETEEIWKANLEFIKSIIPQLESYYTLLVLLKSLTNNKQVKNNLESIKIISNMLIIDDKIKINYSFDTFIVDYNNLQTRNIKNIEYVIMLIKLYIRGLEQFEYILKNKLTEYEIESIYTQQNISYTELPDKDINIDVLLMDKDNPFLNELRSYQIDIEEKLIDDFTGWTPNTDMNEGRMYFFIRSIATMGFKKSIIICGKKVFNFFKKNRLSKSTEDSLAFFLYNRLFFCVNDLNETTGGNIYPVFILSYNDLDYKLLLNLKNPIITKNNNLVSLNVEYQMLNNVNDTSFYCKLIKLD